MMAKNHLLVTSAITIGISSYSIISFSSNYHFLIFYFSALLGCLLPDIDEKESYIGRKLLFISVFVSLFLKHKTLTHYLIVPVMLGCSGYYFFLGYSQLIIYGLTLGILLHGFEDMVTNNGIRGYFFPFFNKTNIVLLPSFLRLETGGTVELSLTYVIFLPLNFILVFKDYL